MVLIKRILKNEYGRSIHPLITIKNIGNGFKNIGLATDYYGIDSKDPRFFSGIANIKNTEISSFGKGPDEISSKASAYGELAERFSSGVFAQYGIYMHPKVQDKIVSQSRVAITSGKFISSYNYSHECDLKKNHIPISNFIPEDLKISEEQLNTIKKSDLTKHWCKAESLMKDRNVMVPLPFINFFTGSTGLGAGNTIEEAIVKGTYEIFERYALGKVILDKIAVKDININGIKDQKLLGLLEYYKELGISIKFKDFTFNSTFPCVGVIFINNNLANEKNPIIKDYFHIRIKIGVDLDLINAIKSCLLEEMQGLSKEECKKGWASMIPLDFNYLLKKWKELGNSLNINEDYNDLLDGWIKGDLKYLLRESESININEFNFKKNEDFYDDIQDLIKICKKSNLEIFFIDYTNKKIKFPVVRVIIPKINSYVINQKLSPFEKIFPELDTEIVPKYTNNPFYIKNIDKYTTDKNWLESDNEVKNFIDSVEEFLSSYILDYNGDFYGKNINLFELLAYAYMFIKNLNKAKIYFEILAFGLNLEDYKEIINKLEKNMDIPNKYFGKDKTNPFWIDKLENEDLEFERKMEDLADQLIS